jgi:hypothetical protein
LFSTITQWKGKFQESLFGTDILVLFAVTENVIIQLPVM